MRKGTAKPVQKVQCGGFFSGRIRSGFARLVAAPEDVSLLQQPTQKPPAFNGNGDGAQISGEFFPFTFKQFAFASALPCFVS